MFTFEGTSDLCLEISYIGGLGHTGEVGPFCTLSDQGLAILQSTISMHSIMLMLGGLGVCPPGKF